MSLSPVNHCTTPPDGAIFFCISAIIAPAFAAAVTAPSSIFPATLLEKLTIAFPN